MTFLPIVERELRVRARRPSTHWVRAGFALVAVGIVGVTLLLGWNLSPAQIGPGLFKTISWIAFLFCVSEGLRGTSDCLSLEKREGTLGLLFLTDLHGYDVVLGKLLANSLNSIYGLLAIFPGLAIPLIIGGVTAGEFWRVVLMLLIALFFSLATGMLASAVSRKERSGEIWTMAILLLSCFLLPLAHGLTRALGAAGKSISPTTALLAAADSRYTSAAGDFWMANGTVALLTLIFLAAACYALPHSWQDRPLLSRVVPAPQTAGGGVPRRQLFPKWTGAENPSFWLARRAQGTQLYLWILIGCVVSGAGAALWIGKWSSEFLTAIAVGVVAFHWLLAVQIGGVACRLMSEARDSGLFDLMIITPITTEEIIEGHFLAIRRFYAKPVGVLFGSELALLTIYLIIQSGRADFAAHAWTTTLFVTGGFAVMVGFALADFFSIARYGMWMGISTKRLNQARTKTLLFFMILPLLAACCWPLAPIMWLGKDFAMLSYSRDQIRLQFRAIIVSRFGGEVSLNPFAVVPEAAMPNYAFVMTAAERQAAAPPARDQGQPRS